MMKNSIYPIIEDLLKNYIYNFPKDKFSIGLTNKQIQLDKLKIRPDPINKLFNDYNIPIWTKYGQINKINIYYNIMNIIGENPFEMTIEDVTIILCPSYKWLIKDILLHSDYYNYHKNKNNLEAQKENLILSKLNKSYVNIYDKKYDEESKNIFDTVLKKCVDFYLLINFPVNIVIKNLHIKFEDDELINDDGNICFGLFFKKIALCTKNVGNKKVNCLKVEAGYLYYDKKKEKNIVIPSFYLYKNLNNMNEYYRLINTIDKKLFQLNLKSEDLFLVIDNFSFEINFGTALINSNDDLFISDINSYLVYLKINIALLNINITYQLVSIIDKIRKFCKDFNCLKYIKNNKLFNNIKLLRSKDFLNYIIFFRRVRSHKNDNKLKREFNRYMANYGYKKENEDKEIKEKDLFIIDDTLKNSNGGLDYFENKKEGVPSNNYTLFGEALSNRTEPLCNIKDLEKKIAFYILINTSKININIYINNQNPKKELTISLTNANFESKINQIKLNLYFNVSAIMFIFEESFYTLERSAPKFQFRFNNYKTSNLLSTNINDVNQKNDKSLNASESNNGKIGTGNRNKFARAGLKERSTSSFIGESVGSQLREARLYRNNAKYMKKMKILSETLKIANNPNLPFKQNNFNPGFDMEKKFYGIKGDFLSRVLAEANKNERSNYTNRNCYSIDSFREKRDESISKAISDYNNQKAQNIIFNTTQTLRKSYMNNNNVNNFNTYNNDFDKSKSFNLNNQSPNKSFNAVTQSISPIYRNSIIVENNNISNKEENFKKSTFYKNSKSINLNMASNRQNEYLKNKNQTYKTENNIIQNKMNELPEGNNDNCQKINSINPFINAEQKEKECINNNNLSFSNYNNINADINGNNTYNQNDIIQNITLNNTNQNAKNYLIPFISIFSSNAENKSLYFSYTKYKSIKDSNNLTINILNIRINVFKEYISKLYNIMNSFKLDEYLGKYLDQNSNILIKILSHNIRIQKYLYIMKKYIYTYLTKCKETIRNRHKDYYLYIKRFISKFPFIDNQFMSFESNYLFSYYFSNSLEINFNYVNFDFLLYENTGMNTNNVLTHLRVPKINLNLFLALSYLYAKIYDIEIEVSEYDRIYDVISYIYNEVISKFKHVIKLFKMTTDKIQGTDNNVIYYARFENKSAEDVDINENRNVCLVSGSNTVEVVGTINNKINNK